MATFTSEDRDGRLRTTMQLEPGERVKLCRCWRSKTFPFCDESHKQVKDNLGPLTIQALPVPSNRESSASSS